MTDAWLEKVPGIRDIVDDTQGGAITMPREAKLVIRGAVDLIPEAGALVLDFSGLGAGSLPAVDGDDNGSILRVVGGVWTVGPANDYDITSFTTTTLVECGQSITPTFAAAHNHVPTSLVLTNNANAEARNVVGTPNGFSTLLAVVRNTPNQTYVYTLTGSDGLTGDVANVTITWGQRNYAGVAASGSSHATMKAAATYNTLDTNGTFSFTVTSTGGSQRACFLFPSRYGVPTLKDADTGFGVGITYVGTSSDTNAQGFSENYDRYELDSAFVGTKTFDVTN
jgi:hypothetical protein